MEHQARRRHRRCLVDGAAAAMLAAAVGWLGPGVTSAHAAELVEYLLYGLGLTGSAGFRPLEWLERLSVWLLEPLHASLALLGAGLWITWRVFRRR
jgi:hypothetical protein